MMHKNGGFPALLGGMTVILGLSVPQSSDAGGKFQDLAEMADLTEFRSIDGSGNNLANPDWGRAETPFLRLTSIAYEDGFGTPSGADRPNPRIISNAVLDQGDRDVPALTGVSDFFWQWGQFIDHDITLTPIAGPGEFFNIPVPTGDPWFDPFHTGAQIIRMDRSNYVLIDDIRQQRNFITAFLDASMVYGSDDVRSLELRMLDGTGRMKYSRGRMLPLNLTSLPNEDDRFDPDLFLAGDVRANEQVALAAVHTLFMREHNFWTKKVWREMKRENKRRRKAGEPELELTDEFIYQLCRAIVAAEIQSITYNEWLPHLLGPDALANYGGYDKTLNPGISNAFATAAFRLGHSLLTPRLLKLKRNGSEWRDGELSLRDAFFNAPEHLTRKSIAPFLRGLGTQPAQELDALIIDDVRNFLFGPPGAGGLDLGSLNIQRGRDHGLPSYNQVRVDYGLEPRESFAQITSDESTRAGLAAAYPSVDQVDLWVGGLAEDDVPGAMVGETFFVILLEQFAALRDGDRFWYENYLDEGMIELIESQTLCEIIRRNTRVNREMQEDVFALPDS